MKKKIVGILICMLLLLTPVFPVFGVEINSNKISNEKQIICNDIESTKIWNRSHTVTIWIDKIYIIESGDREGNEPGEYFFRIYAFPKLWHHVTANYEVSDEHPETPHDFGKLGAFKTRFTPQFILIISMDDDSNDGVTNFNDFLGWKVFKLKPYKDNFPSSDPYIDTIKWDNPRYFNAIVKLIYSYDEH
jgi:hypothetical protein